MSLNTRKAPLACAAAGLVLLLLNAAPALAYMGPGLGLGAIGTALGVIGALLLMLVSIVWYPAKRMLRKMRGEKAVPPANRK